MKKKILLSVYFCLISLLTINAQQLGLYFLDGVVQSNQLNPAFVPKQKVVYALPGLIGGYHNSIAPYNDLVTTNAEGVNVLNGTILLNNMSDNNYVRGGFDMHTFHTVYGKKTWRVSMSHAIKFDSYVNLPRDLISLAVNGNAAAIGETFEIAPDLQLNMYSETAFGFMIKLGKINVGAKVKLFSGIANVSTDRTSATVTTDEEYYQLDIATDYRINAAGLVDVQNLDNFGNFDLDFDTDEFSMSDLFNDMSIGLDLGASVHLLDDKLTVAASIIDIGKIKWKNAYNYHSEGDYTYEGVDVRDMVNDDEVSFDETVDTLKQIFNFTETSNDYTTWLPAKSYISGNYKISKLFSAGGVVYYENFRGKGYGGFALNGSMHVSQMLNLGLTWSSVYKTNSLGAHLMVKLGPVQLMALTDNIMSMFKPYDNQNFNAQFGLNIALK